MKTLLTKLLPAMVIIGLLGACKKENPALVLPEEPDYRAAFIGDYHFTYYSYTWVYTQGSSDTTIYYDGTITFGSTDSTVIFQATPYNDDVEFTVNANGELGECIGCSQDFHYSRYGHFTADSAYLYIGYNGLGGRWGRDLKGEKY